jgi:hypothetical protein
MSIWCLPSIVFLFRTSHNAQYVATASHTTSSVLLHALFPDQVIEQRNLPETEVLPPSEFFFLKTPHQTDNWAEKQDMVYGPYFDMILHDNSPLVNSFFQPNN